MTLTSLSEEKQDTTSKRPDEKEAKMSHTAQITLQLVGAAIFSALSIVISIYIVPLLPRVPGMPMAYIDPISFIWITCFLVFGAEAGLLCCGIGTVGLMFADIANAPWGPLMKFAATFSLIIVPIIFTKISKRKSGERESQILKKPKNFIFYGALGTGLRIIVTLVLNIILAYTVYAAFIAYVNLDFLGHPEISGINAVIIGFPIVNAWQSAFDLLIPYAIVFGAMDYGLKLDEKYEIW